MEGLISQDSGARWRFLVDNPALKSAHWLPPAADVPELADLRAEHERLRALEAETVADFMALQAQRDREEEARRAAQEQEFLGRKKKGELPPITVGDEQLLDAKVRAEAAKDAIQTFARGAIGQIRERADGLREGLEKIEAEAAAKEQEAEVLMAEADRLKLGTLRLRAWLERTIGKSPLGHIPWDELPAPVQPKDLTIAELHEAAVPAWGVVELVDSGGPAFGTDDPDDLDPDDSAARPWEVALHD